MPRLVSAILGDYVQNVGYRLFVLSAMKQRGLVGFVTNLADGKQVSIEVWGNACDLNEFYDFIQKQKPSGVKYAKVGPKTIDNVRKPKAFDLLNEKMDLMIEQTGKFVEEGKIINKKLGRLPKQIGKEVGVEVRDSLKYAAHLP